jgi:hypothetical protein
LLLPFFLMVATAQSQTNMENKNSVTAEGEIVKKGKLIYSEIIIKATPSKVWKVFTDFEKYPEWNPFIKSLKKNPVKGKKIEAFIQVPEMKGMLFKPTVLTYDSLTELRWIGKLFIGRIFDGEHTFKIKDNKDGTVTFIQYERFRGILVPFFKKMLDNNTKAGYVLMNTALKTRCEN